MSSACRAAHSAAAIDDGEPSIPTTIRLAGSLPGLFMFPFWPVRSAIGISRDPGSPREMCEFLALFGYGGHDRFVGAEWRVEKVDYLSRRTQDVAGGRRN